MLIIIYPLISHKARGSSLRKVKTDAIDAYLLCELFYKEELDPKIKTWYPIIKPEKPN